MVIEDVEDVEVIEDVDVVELIKVIEAVEVMEVVEVAHEPPLLEPMSMYVSPCMLGTFCISK